MNLVNPVALPAPQTRPGTGASHEPPAAAAPRPPDEPVRVMAPLQVQIPNPFLGSIPPLPPVVRPSVDRVVIGATGSDAAKR